MGRLNTKNFGIYIKQGATPPVAPLNFVEVDEKILLTPTVAVDNFKRYSGKLGANDSYADTCNTGVEGIAVSHKMRYQNTDALALDTIPEYGELLKISGFTETVAGGVGNEAVTYDWDTSSSPALGSAVYYIDGNKQTLTNTVAGNSVFNFEIGKAAMLNFAMSGFLDNSGVSVPEANPTTTLSTEGCLIVGCADIYTEDGTQLNPTNISIDMGSQINKFYGMGLKEYQLTDFEPKITTDFYLDNADYNNAIQKLKDQALVNVVIKLGTLDGADVNGKTVTFTISNVKFSSFSDADSEDTIKRTHELMLTGSSAFSIKHGWYA